MNKHNHACTNASGASERFSSRYGGVRAASGSSRRVTTIVAGSAHGVPGGANTLLMHDGSMRHYTVREAARIQTFPDTYTLPSTWSVAFRQLGNAVPCNLARAWGHRIKRALQKEK